MYIYISIRTCSEVKAVRSVSKCGISWDDPLCVMGRQYGNVCCRRRCLLQSVAVCHVCCSVSWPPMTHCMGVCCSLLQCVMASHDTLHGSLLQSVAVCHGIPWHTAWESVAVCCSVSWHPMTHCMGVCCSLLQCVMASLHTAWDDTHPLTHCNRLQQTATHRTTMQQTAPCCNTPRHSATYKIQ